MKNHKTSMQRLARLANEIAFHPKERGRIFLELSQEERAMVIMRLSKRVRQSLLTHIPETDLLALLEKVDPDDATDLMQLLGRRKRDKLLVRLSYELKDTVSKLLEFDPDTAAGLMNIDYIQADVNDDIASVSEKFKLHEQRTGRLPVILAMENEHLAGALPVHQLGFVRANERIEPHIKHIPTVNQSASHTEVAELFRTHPHNKIAVLSNEDDVIGIIYSDDVLELMHERESASLYDFAGLSAEENVADPARRKVKLRYKWLIINLATAFLAAFTVGLFEDTITKYVLLAVYMPIVAGMGGNAATQTLAVMVRGIALKQISLKTAIKALKSEVGAGFVNGLINGFLVALVVLIKDNDPLIALILALAMVANLVVAALFGTLVPIIMSKLKKDPATSATIFITTATDVLGFLVFLGLAALILQ